MSNTVPCYFRTTRCVRPMWKPTVPPNRRARLPAQEPLRTSGSARSVVCGQAFDLVGAGVSGAAGIRQEPADPEFLTPRLATGEASAIWTVEAIHLISGESLRSAARSGAVGDSRMESPTVVPAEQCYR
jgi:hypothetical protein